MTSILFLYTFKVLLEDLISEDDLKGEGNLYYDYRKCGIGYHGDTERSKVIGVRFRDSSKYCPLIFQWYLEGEKVGEKITIQLNSGDCYIMSEKATGNDWKNLIITYVICYD